MSDPTPAFDRETLVDRVTRNEARFREINEVIESGRDRDDAVHRVGFVCECALADCARIVEMTPADYEAVRANPRRFFVVAGHEIPDGERVVETHERYLVVEKVAGGAQIAEETDPRAD